MKKSVYPRHKADKQERPNRKNCNYRGHNYRDTHYVYLHHSNEHSDDEEVIQLHRRNEEYLEKELEPGDTLQTLAIQFSCPVAELKRVNHIHRENEIFARRKIKIPTKYYSLLSEKLVGVHKPPSASTSYSSLEDQSQQSHASGSGLQPITSDRPLRVNKDSFLSSIHTAHDICDDDFDENTDSPLLENVESHPEKEEVFQCNGSDWGLSWAQLLICTLLLGFAGPLVYIFYLREELIEKNGDHSISSNNTITNNNTIVHKL